METIMAVPGIGPYIPWIALAVTICSLLAAALPAPTSTTGIYYFLYQLVNTVAVNFGHGKNLSAPESKGIVGGPGAITAPQVATSSKPLTPPTPMPPAS